MAAALSTTARPAMPGARLHDKGSQSPLVPHSLFDRFPLFEALELEHCGQRVPLMPGSNVEQTDNLALLLPRHGYARLESRQHGLRVR